MDVSSAAAAVTTTASPQEAAVLKVAKDQIAQLEQVVDSMARQLMQQQTFVEERLVGVGGREGERERGGRGREREREGEK